MSLTLEQKQARMDELVGLPFVLVPGKLKDHVVCGESFTGEKYRVCEVQGIFNDALLVDAIEGEGYFRKTCNLYTRNVLEVAERIYGVTLIDALKIWTALPKIKAPMEWPKAGSGN